MPEIIPIVIVNWNAARLLKEVCLKSIVGMDEPLRVNGIKARVIVIDNGSSDNSFRVINNFTKRRDSNIKFEAIWQADDLGFVRSTNLGIKLAFEDPAVNFVATLNPDTKVHPDWLVNLVQRTKETKKKEKIGMFASEIDILEVPKHGIPKTTDEPFNYGHSYHQDGACYDVGFGGFKVDQEKRFCHCHAGALLKREMLEECGLIDEVYFGWYDCPNLGWKARLKGWKFELVEGAKMWHRKSEARRRPEIRGIVERNRILTILRFMPLDKQPLAIGEYLNGFRRDGTNYNEKMHAIKEAKKLFRGQYPADPIVRSNIYDTYCRPPRE